MNFQRIAVVGAGVLILVWAANMLGLRPTMWVAYVTAAMLVVPLAGFMVLPFVTGEWSSASFTATLDDPGQPWGGWKLAIVWLYIIARLVTAAAFLNATVFERRYARSE